MSTVLDLITRAYQVLGIYDPGEPLNSDDATLGLNVCNDMLDSWSNESLTCYEILEQSAPLVPGQQSYTIGPGGNFNMTRPIRIIEGPGSAYVQDTNGNNYQMEVVSRKKWNMYGNRSNVVTSNFPDVLFYDPQFPLGIISVMPFPLLAYTMFWDSYLQFTDFSSLTQTITLPPGYNLAIWTNLAGMLKPFFADGQIDPSIVSMAMVSKGNIKRSNMRIQATLFDNAIVARSGLSYNPYTDRVGSSTSG